jgi:uncharacterized protein (DUF2062 family)
MLPRRREPSPRSAGGEAGKGVWSRLRIIAAGIVRRLGELRASPHEIALGCAAGAFASITPLLGVQTLMAIALAGLMRASVPAAIVGTFVGNPLSWPFIWASTYAMGLHMVSSLQIFGLDGMIDPAAIEQNMLLLWGALIERSPHLLDATAALLWPLLLPMLAGSLPIGLLTAAVVYYISRNVVRAWRVRRMTGPSATAD